MWCCCSSARGNGRRVRNMKVVCGYDPGGPYRPWFGGWADEGALVVVSPEEDVAKFASDLRDAEILLHILRPVTEEVLRGAPRLRLAQKIGVGVDTIDLEAARRRAVAVANMPGTNTQAVAEAALMLMLAALRNLPGLDRECRVGNGWTPEQEAQERRNTLGELCGRTVGLVGAGAVASRVVAPAAYAGDGRSHRPEGLGAHEASRRPDKHRARRARRGDSPGRGPHERPAVGRRPRRASRGAPAARPPAPVAGQCGAHAARRVADPGDAFAQLRRRPGEHPASARRPGPLVPCCLSRPAGRRPPSVSVATWLRVALWLDGTAQGVHSGLGVVKKL